MTMRKIVHKLFWVWEFEKEEKWLNEMSAKGLCLIAVGFCRYEFEECEPGGYNIRLELLDNLPRSVEGESYLSFVEETGAECVGSYLRWVYFRKKTTDGTFDLFSDNTSRIKYLNRIMNFVLILAALNFFAGCYNLWVFFAYNFSINLYGTVNLVLTLLCIHGWFKLYLMRNKLKKEKQVFE